MLFVNKALGVISKVAGKRNGGRWANHVVYVDHPKADDYRLMATNTKIAALITIPCSHYLSASPSVKGHPPEFFEAPQLIDVTAWNKAFEASHAEVGITTNNGAAVLTAVDPQPKKHRPQDAQEDGAIATVKAPKIEGKFPPIPDVFPKADPVFTITFDPLLLIELLTVAAAFNGGDDADKQTVEFRLISQDRGCELRCPTNDRGEDFRGLIMPIAVTDNSKMEGVIPAGEGKLFRQELETTKKGLRDAERGQREAEEKLRKLQTVIAEATKSVQEVPSE